MKRQRHFGKGDSGSVAVVFAIGLVAFLGFTALALDIGHMVSMKNELQRAADAAALSGVRALWPANLVQVNTRQTQPNTDQAVGTARAVATSNNNQVNGVPLAGGNVTVQTGTWNFATRTFTPGTGPNAYAVRVVTRSTASMFFAQVLGASFTDLSATSVANMSPDANQGPGCLPIAVSQNFIDPGENLFINFTPDPNDNAGWFTDPPTSASAHSFQDYIDNADCPPLQIGDIINLQNGDDTAVLQDLQSKLDQHGGIWNVVLPVVDTTQFVQSQPIMGFVGFQITQVVDNGSSKGVNGTVLGMLESPAAAPGDPNTPNNGVLTYPELVY
jgi:Flp pilus assembly protein TadG